MSEIQSFENLFLGSISVKFQPCKAFLDKAEKKHGKYSRFLERLLYRECITVWQERRSGMWKLAQQGEAVVLGS